VHRSALAVTRRNRNDDRLAASIVEARQDDVQFAALEDRGRAARVYRDLAVHDARELTEGSLGKMKGRSTVGARERRLAPGDDHRAAIDGHFNRIRRDAWQIGDDLDGIGRFEDIHGHAVFRGLGAGTSVEPFEIAVIKEDSSHNGPL
jgi:hypothetical protein